MARLYRNNQYCLNFPYETPLQSLDIDVWDTKGNYLGSGSSFNSRNNGYKIIIPDRIITNNEKVFWQYKQKV